MIRLMIQVGTIASATRVFGGHMRLKIHWIIAFLCMAAFSGPVSAGDAVQGGAKKVGSGFGEAGKSAGHYGRKAGKATEGAAKDTGKALGKAAKDIGSGVKKVFR